MSDNDKYMVVDPLGGFYMIRGGYENFRKAVGGNIELMNSPGLPQVSFWAHEEGLVYDLPLNIPLFLGGATVAVGPVVFINRLAGPDGQTLPADLNQPALQRIAGLAEALHQAQESVHAAKVAQGVQPAPWKGAKAS